jgi:ABC-type nitrate/sulfonate/bicarbonate transport system ATPase subunit
MTPGVTRTDVLLEIDHVSLSFGDRLVLRDVHASIRDLIRPGFAQGQVVGLLGPSGMGKTQLFRILAGLAQPTTGRVLLTSKKVPAEPGMVGVVDQHYTLFRHRTVGENLTIAARQAGLSRKEASERAVAEVCRLIGEVAQMDELRTIVVVTHDVTSAAAISDTIWLLGRDRVDGEPVPGARIQGEYDLVERGLTWEPDIERLPAFHELVREIRERFRTL